MIVVFLASSFQYYFIIINMGVVCNNGGGLVKALNANVYGNGTQTLVLAHGFGTDQTVWHYLIPYLVCYFKVVVFDLVFSANVDPKLYNEKKYSNFNGYAEDLLCLLDELNVKTSIYVGHSMSAMIGCIAATKRPEIFQQLVLLSGSPRWFSLSLSLSLSLYLSRILLKQPYLLLFTNRTTLSNNKYSSRLHTMH